MATPQRDTLGRCDCPVCGSDRAAVRLSGKGLAYLVCDACNSQVFARSGKSDQLLRDRIKPDARPVRTPDPEPAPIAAPVPAVRTDEPKPASSVFRWGMMT